MKYSKALIYTPLSCTGLADARFCNWVQKSLKYMDLYSKNLKLHTFYDLALTLLVIQITLMILLWLKLKLHKLFHSQKNVHLKALLYS